jgi:hypothetical protein
LGGVRWGLGQWEDAQKCGMKGFASTFSRQGKAGMDVVFDTK